MKVLLLALAVGGLGGLRAAGGAPVDFTARIAALPVLDERAVRPLPADWLVNPPPKPARIFRGVKGTEIIMDNGLIRRAWRLAPNAATVAYENLMTGQGIVRGVKPMATLTLDGEQYSVG